MKSKSLPISLLAVLLGAFLTAFSPEILAKGNLKNTSTNLGWYSRGPLNIGGSVKAILLDQQDATQKTIIIGNEAGGLWKSIDGGSNWNPINYDENLFVTCLAQADNGDIFIGTGGDYQGTGLYKMTGSTITPVNNSEWESINDISSKENNIYIACNEGLFYYDGTTMVACMTDGATLDGIATEVQVNEGGKIIAVVDKACYISNSSFDAFVNQSNGNANKLPNASSTGSLSIASDNVNSDLFYASIATATGSLNGIYASFNGGETWEVILQGGGTVDPFLYGGVKYGLTHNKIFSINFKEGYNAAYVGGHDLWFGVRPIGGTGYFDFGTNSVTFSATAYNTPLYLHSIVNDMTFVDPTTAYLATDGGIYSSSYFIPSAGMIMFNKLNISLSNTLVNNVNADGDDYVICGTENTAVVVLGKGTNSLSLGTPIWTLSAGTAYYSLEGSSSFNFASLINQNFFLYTLTDNGTFGLRRSDDNGYSYEDLSIIDDMTGLNDLIYWETFDAEYTPDTVVFHAYYDTDSTTSSHYNNWEPGDVVWGYSNHKFNTTDGYPIPYVLDRQLEVGDSVLIPDVIQSRTFAAIGSVVYMSDDVLNMTVTPTWETLATITSETISTLAISANCEDLYIGTESGKVYRIADVNAYYTDTTITYAPVEIANFEGQTISSIFVDKQNIDHVIVTLSTEGFDDNIYASTNGTSDNPVFTSIQNNLPAVPVYTSLIPMDENASTGDIVIGTSIGMYNFDGSVWTKDENIPTIIVNDLFQQNLVRIGHSVPMRNPNPSDTINLFVYENYSASINNGCIYASTFGRGVYQSDIYKTAPVVSISENTTEETISALNIYPNPVSFSTSVEIETTISEEGMLQVYDIQGRCIFAQNIRLHSGKNIHTIDFSAYPEGIYIIRAIYGQKSKTAKVIKNL